LAEYQNFQLASMTLILTSIGQFNYSSYETVQPLVAFFYFFGFIVVSLLIVTKFFTAVVNHEYRVLAEAARPVED
jgi:phosphate starvation-inducible membrane PsiE